MSDDDALTPLREMLARVRQKGYRPTRLKCSVEAWDGMRRVSAQLRDEPASAVGVSIWGLPINLDESMAPHTFGFDVRGQAPTAGTL